MNAFGFAIDAIFDDPNMAEDARWYVGGIGEPVAVRVIRKSPEAIVGLGDNRYDLDAMLLDVRISEIAAPAARDRVEILDDEGEVAETLVVSGLSKIDGSKLVRTCEVGPIQPDDPDEDPDEP